MEEFIKENINIPLLVALISWGSAQIIKIVFYAIKYRTFNPERILGAGGMPSSHSATVTSLAIAVSRVSGINSAEFAIAMVLAMVVMYDATGVRRAAGLHAKAINRLNRIVRELDEEMIEVLEEKIDQPEDSDDDDLENVKQLKEFLGHTPLEVLCGALLGIIIGMAFPIG